MIVGIIISLFVEKMMEIEEVCQFGFHRNISNSGVLNSRVVNT